MEKIKFLEEELKKARIRLNQLNHRALNSPIAKSDEILSQRRIVDDLITKIQREKK